MTKLKKGDTIIRTYRGVIFDEEIVIDRLTKTMAINDISNFRFKLNIGKEYLLESIGDHSYDFYLDNPEMRNKINYQNQLSYIQTVCWKTISDDKIFQIFKILKN